LGDLGDETEKLSVPLRNSAEQINGLAGACIAAKRRARRKHLQETLEKTDG
jgi:hypothetical protein